MLNPVGGIHAPKPTRKGDASYSRQPSQSEKNKITAATVMEGLTSAVKEAIDGNPLRINRCVATIETIIDDLQELTTTEWLFDSAFNKRFSECIKNLRHLFKCYSAQKAHSTLRVLEVVIRDYFSFTTAKSRGKPLGSLSDHMKAVLDLISVTQTSEIDEILRLCGGLIEVEDTPYTRGADLIKAKQRTTVLPGFIQKAKEQLAKLNEKLADKEPMHPKVLEKTTAQSNALISEIANLTAELEQLTQTIAKEEPVIKEMWELLKPSQSMVANVATFAKGSPTDVENIEKMIQDTYAELASAKSKIAEL
jgi:hypothetical protein